MRCSVISKKGWLFSEIFDLIKSLDLENEVILTDYVDESDKPAIYQNAKLFVFPSLYEGFGMPILEAMAAGIPVIGLYAHHNPARTGPYFCQKYVVSVYEQLIHQYTGKLLSQLPWRQRLKDEHAMECITIQQVIEIFDRLYFDLFS